MATLLTRPDRALAAWAIVAAAIAVAAAVFASRPEAASGQTGPALTPSTPTPAPPSEEITFTVGPFTGVGENLESSQATVRVLDVSLRESSPSRRRLSGTTSTAAGHFIDATQGGQPIVGIHISIGATGQGALPGSLTRAQRSRLCFPDSKRPPGVGPEDLVVSPGHRIGVQPEGQTVCVDFVFTEADSFVVGARTQPVLPEFAGFYASTGGQPTWGPCLTHGFFASVGQAGTIVEAPTGSGVYIQVCANGVLGYHPELAGSGFEIQPVLATHWVRGEGGQFVGSDPPVANSGEGRYFPQTGHNVSGPFLSKFLALGGADLLGYPITEPLAAAPGFTDQYFQHLKLRLNDGTGEVTIRPIGREFIAILAANRQAGAESP